MTATSTSIASTGHGEVSESHRAGRFLPDYMASQIATGLAGILKELGEAPRLLEIAIGEARLGPALAAHGVATTAVDPTRREQGGSRTRAKKSSKTDLTAKSFDAAILVDVLPFVRDPEATIREALKLVRPGGMILCATVELEGAEEAVAHQAIRSAASAATDGGAAEGGPEQALVGLFAKAVDEAWLELVEVGRWWEPVSGQAVIDAWSARAVPGSTTLGDDELKGAVAAAGPAVAEAFDGLDHEVEARRTFSVMVARLG